MILLIVIFFGVAPIILCGAYKMENRTAVVRFLDIMITKPIILVLAVVIGAAFIFLGR